MGAKRSKKKTSRTALVICGGAVLVLVTVLVAIVAVRGDDAEPHVQTKAKTPSSPPAAAAARSPSGSRIDAPFYCQADPRWATQTIGGSGETIRRVGCTLCCLTMALHHRGFAVDPARLNAGLKKHDGYTSRGWLVWDAVPAVTKRRFGMVVSNSPTRAEIDQQLLRGNPVIAKVPSKKKGKSHWVLIVGKDGSGYVIHDPGTSRGRFNALGDRGTSIRGIRYLEDLQ